MSIQGYDWFDFKSPDYIKIFQQRVKRLQRIREGKVNLDHLKAYYRDHIPQFIVDWGCTTDPRNLEVDLPDVVPFVLFKRQVEWIEWVLDSWRSKRPGVTPKSRESGVSWLAVSTASSLALFHDGFVCGFGSRKEIYVDEAGSPKSLFWKARKFVELLPREFRNGFNVKSDAPYMRIMFRQTGSILTGEAGDNIGRGDRTSIYFVDEADHLEHPKITDQSLSATTNCRIDISTPGPKGLGGPFHTKVTSWPKERVFWFHWRDDPRKDEAWYLKQKDELDPVTVAQEIDIDFAASVEGVLIPSAWVQAAVDAHITLKLEATGPRYGALDVADEGKDLSAFCGAHGVVIEHLEEWSGKGDDIFGTVERAFLLCDELDYGRFRYDADGLGAGVRGDARVINERRRTNIQNPISVDAFRGSAGVVRPEAQDTKGRKNEDFFQNLKSQSWWSLRMRFLKTFRAVTAGASFDRDEIISIPKDLSNRSKLCMELSQPTYSINGAGKIVVDKAPEGSKSPNLADAVMIRFAKIDAGMPVITGALLQELAALGGRR
jgi:phage terminase large subunit